MNSKVEPDETILTEDELDAIISAYLDCKAIARSAGVTDHDISPLTAAVDKILADRRAIAEQTRIANGDEPPALEAS